jgi:CDP-6-deoxy-D-xylo-4-hexulose-3-dehydrase
MLYALSLWTKLKNKKVVVAAVSWTTTVSPIIHLGMSPILCDCNMENLGVDLTHLEEIFKKENPAVLMIVHVLGFPCDIEKIQSLCKKYDVFLLEDSCECVGSHINGKKMGTYGVASSFSFYFGHHMSTIEGGMITTNDFELYEIIKSIRSHGLDRDLSFTTQNSLRRKNKVGDFKALYTFYFPGFNLRSTDLQATIGLRQMTRIDSFCEQRYQNLLTYDRLIKNDYWKIKIQNNMFVSNFAYPIIHPNIENVIQSLKKNEIDCRPLVCGSIGEQPYWVNLFGKCILSNSSIVHNNGIYVPNNHELTDVEIKTICNVVNNSL